MALPVILIFDVGKTNKKALLFNRQYELVYESSKQLDETTDEDGFSCEDVHLLTAWIEESYQEINADHRFEIVAVNVSAYGASLVHLDHAMQPFLPLYNYLKPYPKQLQEQFYNLYDREGTFALDAASPVLDNLNSGMQMYWLKHTKPEQFSRITYSLHLPQYVVFVLSRMCYTDITSIGCHTALWNFKKDSYHDWVFEENLIKKFPLIVSFKQVSNIKNTYIPVGAGLHDSSAALIPYLATFTEPFVLLSTGTWCISLNPFNHTPLTNEDLQRDCLCYLTHEGNPVKASRLFAGHEHEQQVKRLAAYFKNTTDDYKKILFDPSLCPVAKNETEDRKEKTVMVEQSPFGNRSLSTFSTYQQAYHQLIADLIAQQTEVTRLVMRDAPVKNMFVDGGFSKNDVYMHLLAEAFFGVNVYSATVAQASAVGAAIAIQEFWNNQPLPATLVSVKHYKPAKSFVV